MTTSKWVWIIAIGILLVGIIIGSILSPYIFPNNETSQLNSNSLELSNQNQEINKLNTRVECLQHRIDLGAWGINNCLGFGACPIDNNDNSATINGCRGCLFNVYNNILNGNVTRDCYK